MLRVAFRKPASGLAACAAQSRWFSGGLGYESLAGPKENLKDQIVLVTGSTDGIGFNTASLLASNNATVLIHGRSKNRVQRAVDAIRGLSGREKVFGYAYDLASFSAIREFAAEVKEDLAGDKFGESTHLAALVNNAGVVNPEREDSPDGLEYSWAVNAAAPFLLTAELLPVISDRVVNVTSISQADILNLKEIQNGFESYERHGLAAYGQSKLALTMFTTELAHRLKQVASPITTVAVDPGTVHTKLLSEGWGDISQNVGVMPEQVDDVFWAVVEPELKKATGGFAVSKKLRAPPRAVRDVDTQEALWDLLVRQTGAMYPF